MASNKHVDLIKIENLVRSKYHHQDISKDKGNMGNFRNSCENFKIVDVNPAYKDSCNPIFIYDL